MVSVVLFVASTAFVIYILFGYPALLRLLTALWSRPVHRQPSVRPVSILIAVHNGGQFVESKIRSILALNYPASSIEIILACDGCTDQTESIARRVAAGRATILSLPRGGKAAALNEAMKVAAGDILVFTDIRQALDPDCLSYLIESFADSSVGVVSGQLVILKGNSREEADVGLYWRYEFWLRSQLSRLDSFFGATGACYAIRRELAVPIPPGTLLDDMYEPLAAFFRGYRLIVDERARVFDYPTTLDTEYHRKVRTLAGNYQILAAYPALLGPRNRLWGHFMSYKFGRLLLPFALLVIVITSFGLPAPWALPAISGQAVVYSLALVDPWIPDRVLVKRLTSIARTFLVLMIATVQATKILFADPGEDLWKPTRVAHRKP